MDCLNRDQGCDTRFFGTYGTKWRIETIGEAPSGFFGVKGSDGFDED
jgi:hypothetical protein